MKFLIKAILKIIPSFWHIDFDILILTYITDESADGNCVKKARVKAHTWHAPLLIKKLAWRKYSTSKWCFWPIYLFVNQANPCALSLFCIETIIKIQTKSWEGSFLICVNLHDFDLQTGSMFVVRWKFHDGIESMLKLMPLTRGKSWN